MKNSLNSVHYFALILSMLFFKVCISQQYKTVAFVKGKVFIYNVREVKSYFNANGDEKTDTVYKTNYRIKVSQVLSYNDTLDAIVLSNFFYNYGKKSNLFYLLFDKRNRRIYTISEKELHNKDLAKQLASQSNSKTLLPVLNTGKYFTCDSIRQVNVSDENYTPENIKFENRFPCLESEHFSKKHNGNIQHFTTDIGATHQHFVMNFYWNELLGFVKYEEFLVTSKVQRELRFELTSSK